MGKLTIVCWILQALHIYYVSCCLPSMARFHKLKQPLRLYLWAKYGSSRPPYGTLGTYVTRHTPQAHYVTNPTCRTWIHEDTCRTRIWHVSCAQDMCRIRVWHVPYTCHAFWRDPRPLKGNLTLNLSCFLMHVRAVSYFGVHLRAILQI